MPRTIWSLCKRLGGFATSSPGQQDSEAGQRDTMLEEVEMGLDVLHDGEDASVDIVAVLAWPHGLGSTSSAACAFERLPTEFLRNTIPTNMDPAPNQLKQCLRDMRVRLPEYILHNMEINRGKVFPQTCKWVLEREEFCAWSTSPESSLLCITGAPGVGKTMISTFLVKFLKERVEKSHGGLFAYFFCADKESDRKSPTAILRSLIWQLLVQRKELFPAIQTDYERHTKARVFEDLFCDFLDLWFIFRKMIQHCDLGEVYILIDALDECEISERQNLLWSIASFFKSVPERASSRVKFILTYRDNIDDIEEELTDVGSRLRLHSAANNDDLDTYISAKLDELEKRKKYGRDLKVAVRNSLKGNVDGTFLWVSLIVAELTKLGVKNEDVPGILTTMPQSLDEFYAGLLAQIESHRDHVAFIFKCMIAAPRPLTKDFMAKALALKNTGTSQNSSTYDDMISACGSIVSLSSNNPPTLSFCHKSVKDFLLKENPPPVPWYCTTYRAAKACLDNVCGTLTAEERPSLEPDARQCF
ncbi:NACHT and ankyrin domain [Cordyceps militaris]|uniref:NACHT and ankyrin domain n=1 Tax=Cordyceps militaris TaxID=73501 RepID=A0A2H4SRH4_CORMI|nr:NACHT and ankyrin domain [Cordyceps militaris]